MVPQMPFPKTSGGVTEGFQVVADGMFAWIQPLGGCWEQDMLMQANTFGIATSKQCCKPQDTDQIQGCEKPNADQCNPGAQARCSIDPSTHIGKTHAEKKFWDDAQGAEIVFETREALNDRAGVDCDRAMSRIDNDVTRVLARLQQVCVCGKSCAMCLLHCFLL